LDEKQIIGAESSKAPKPDYPKKVGGRSGFKTLPESFS
jgi:hypothetical protein